MATHDISVALATYNGARYLSRQLDSLIAQASPPAEIVVTDDSSTDETLAILADYATRAPLPIRVHPGVQRLGYRANFMRAASLCRSPLIAFCDQDDVWAPGKLAQVREAFADPQVMLVYHNAAIVDAAERPYGMLYRGEEQRAALEALPLAPWHASLGFTQTFRARLRAFDDLCEAAPSHLADEPMAHDRWYFFLAASIGRIAYIDNGLAQYRQHGANACGVSRFPRIRRLIDSWQGADEASKLAAPAARGRAKVLRAIADRLESPEKEWSLMLAAKYDTLAARLERRRLIYAGSSFARRARALALSIRCGDYGRREASFFSAGDLSRDIGAGVLRGATVARGMDRARRLLPAAVN